MFFTDRRERKEEGEKEHPCEKGTLVASHRCPDRVEAESRACALTGNQPSVPGTRLRPLTHPAGLTAVLFRDIPGANSFGSTGADWPWPAQPFLNCFLEMKTG